MYSVVAPFFGCAVGIFLLGTATRTASPKGVIIGSLLGYALVLWVSPGLLQLPAGSWEFAAWSLEESQYALGKPISKFWLSFVSLTGTVVCGYVLSLGLPRRAEHSLRNLTIWDLDATSKE